MISRNETAPLLFRFQEDTLGVSPADSLEAMRHQAKLHFFILNISPRELVFSRQSGFSMELGLTIGEGSHSLFTPRDSGGWGNILCPDGFTASGWNRHPLKKNKLQCTLKPQAGKTISLKPGLSLPFTWERISSTAPEGYASLQISFHGLKKESDATGPAGFTLYDSLFKKQIDTRILRLSASPATGAPGQEITLSWSIENASGARLFPGGYDVLGPVPQRSYSRKVTLSEQTDHYCLNLTGAERGVFQDINVFVVPPAIKEFYLDNKRKIFWEACFASGVFLEQLKENQKSGEGQKVDPAGSLPLDSQATAISLRCEGLYQVERMLAVPPAPEILAFYAEYTTFPGHRLVRLFWKTAGLASLALYAGDGAAYTLSAQPEGSWEQVYPLGQPLIYTLNCRTAAGAKHMIVFKKEGTRQ